MIIKTLPYSHDEMIQVRHTDICRVGIPDVENVYSEIIPVNMLKQSGDYNRSFSVGCLKYHFDILEEKNSKCLENE